MTEIEPQRQAIDRTRANNSLDSLHHMVEQYTRDADRLAEAGDYVGLGGGLARLRDIRSLLGHLEKHIEDNLAKAMPKTYIEEAGLTMRRRRTATAKRWQSMELFRHLFGDQLIDARTGENVFDLLTAVVPFTGSLSWRTTALRDAGVDIEDWAEVTPGRTTVDVEMAKGALDG